MMIMWRTVFNMIGVWDDLNLVEFLIWWISSVLLSIDNFIGLIIWLLILCRLYVLCDDDFLVYFCLWGSLDVFFSLKLFNDGFYVF